MIQRCSPENPRSDDYLGRGISVCERWKASFVNFFADVGERPSPKHTLDRINNDKGYDVGNVRWALPLVQQNNKRTNIRVSYLGQTMTLQEARRAAGEVVAYQAAYRRFVRLGWTIEDAVTIPATPNGKR